MRIVYERCAALDVHKKTVVACAITPKGRRHGWGGWIRTSDLLIQSQASDAKGSNQAFLN